MRLILLLVSACVLPGTLSLTTKNATVQLATDEENLPDGQKFVKIRIWQLKTPAKLRCDLTAKLEKDKMIWLKNNKKLKCDENKYKCLVTKDSKNYSLVINQVDVTSDLGQYRCASESDVNSFGASSFLHMAPVLEITRMSANSDDDFKPTEGEKVILRCAVKGAYPALRKPVKWFWRNKSSPKLLNEFPEGIKIQDANNSAADLVIDKVKLDNRVVYVCAGNNSIGRGQEAVYLRVKGRLAALWPAIGIIAELVVLVVIISVSEVVRLRTRANKKDDFADLAPVATATTPPAEIPKVEVTGSQPEGNSKIDT